jgi:hypothetical protein
VVWWVFWGVLGFAVLVFLIVLATLGRRLGPLRRELDRLRIRAEQADRVREKSEAMRERMLALQDEVEHLRPPPGGFGGVRRP